MHRKDDAGANEFRERSESKRWHEVVDVDHVERFRAESSPEFWKNFSEVCQSIFERPKVRESQNRKGLMRNDGAWRPGHLAGDDSHAMAVSVKCPGKQINMRFASADHGRKAMRQ